MVAISEIRKNIKDYRLRVERGQIISVQYFNETIGYLVPIEVAQSLNLDDTRIQTLGLQDFRSNMSNSWQQLLLKTDCIIVRYHDRSTFAFVAERVYPKGDDNSPSKIDC